LLFVASGLLPTAAVQNPSQQRPPVFRGESVLVTVDAYPHRDGKIVEGLKAEDFQILEDGKPQTVETVEFIRVEPTLAEAERRDPDSVGEMLKLAGDPHNRVFVVFLDQLHVTVDGSRASQRPVVDTLNRIIAPNDLFGVMTQNTDPRALTLGRRLISVEEQLSKYWTWGERYRSSTDPADPMEEALIACYKFLPKPPNYPPWYVSDNGQQRYLYSVLIDRRREDRTLTALEKLVDQLGDMREARSVVIIMTEGWRLFERDTALANQAGEFGPAPPSVGTVGGRLGINTRDPREAIGPTKDVRFCQSELVRLADLDDQRRLRELTVRANRANVSFYPVNPAGLQTFDTPMSERSRPRPMEDFNRLRGRDDGLLTLAENTDGIAIVRTNDVAGGMRRIVEDVSAYYLLGYYTTNVAHDGKYRRIDVKTKSAGVTMRARRGYFAPSNKPLRDAIVAAPSGPEPPKGIDDALGELSRLRASADVFVRGTIAGDRLQLAVELASTRAGVSPWTNGADVQVIVTPEGGAAAAPVTARLDAGTRGTLLTLPVAGAATTARVVAKISAGGETV